MDCQFFSYMSESWNLTYPTQLYCIGVHVLASHRTAQAVHTSLVVVCWEFYCAKTSAAKEHQITIFLEMVIQCVVLTTEKVGNGIY